MNIPFPYTSSQPNIETLIVNEGTNKSPSTNSMAPLMALFATCFLSVGATSSTHWNRQHSAFNQSRSNSSVADSHDYERFFQSSSDTETINTLPSVRAPLTINELDSGSNTTLMHEQVRGQTLQRITRLQDKLPGWKGENSIPASSRAGAQAMHIQDALIKKGLYSPPMVSADEDGEIIFYWNNVKAIMSMSFGGDGTYCLYISADGSECVMDDLPVQGSLPKVLIPILEKIK